MTIEGWKWHRERLNIVSSNTPFTFPLQALRVLIVVVALLNATLAGAAAPLHRCALEDWPAENYHAYVFHHGPLDPADQELVDVLASAPPKLGVNLLVSTVDTLKEMDAAIEALWNAQTNTEPPWLVVLSPRRDTTNAPIWSSALRTPSVGAILGSPARNRIAQSLLEGDSAVWLLVECGDTVRDEAAVDLLAGELKRLEKELRSAKAGPGNQLKSDLPLIPHFALIRVTRIDVAEEFLLNTLITAEDTMQRPLAFPIFGRGRVLPPLTGRHLNEEAIGRHCKLLMGDCTNGIRETTQGSELLLGAHWNSIFEKASPVTPIPSTAAKATPASETLNSSPTNAVPETRLSTLPEPSSFGGFAAGLILAAVVGFALMKVWRPRQP